MITKNRPIKRSRNPIKPACLCTTHASHIAVRPIGIDINWPTRTIHTPGLGRKLSPDGMAESTIVGKATPRPSDKKIKRDTKNDWDKPHPIAAPINGPVHGVATITVKHPNNNELRYPVVFEPMPPSRVNEVPNSILNNKVKAIAKNKTDKRLEIELD